MIHGDEGDDTAVLWWQHRLPRVIESTCISDSLVKYLGRGNSSRSRDLRLSYPCRKTLAPVRLGETSKLVSIRNSTFKGEVQTVSWITRSHTHHANNTIRDNHGSYARVYQHDAVVLGHKALSTMSLTFCGHCIRHVLYIVTAQWRSSLQLEPLTDSRSLE
jgi:hypothetical protein